VRHIRYNDPFISSDPCNNGAFINGAFINDTCLDAVSDSSFALDKHSRRYGPASDLL
jgi:hypothetical protein